jgi:phage-related minor tail protein
MDLGITVQPSHLNSSRQCFALRSRSVIPRKNSTYHKVLLALFSISIYDLAKIGNAIAKIGNAITKIGNAITKIGNAIAKIGNAVTKIGNAIMKIGNASVEY